MSVLRRLAGAGAGLPEPVRRRLRRVPGAYRARDWLAGRPSLPPVAPGALRPVVYLPTWARWDSMRQRPQYILEAFAAHGHDVYFVDPRERAAKRAGPVRIVPSLADVPVSGVILYVHFAPVREMFSNFDDVIVVYDILDDLSIYDPDEIDLPADRRVRAHHPAVAQEASVVMVSNPLLAERHSPERPDLLLVENGVDPERFNDQIEPAPELGRVADGRPIIGYHGAIAPWFDFELLAEVAKREPGWRFALVGPTDPRVADAAQELAALPNVELLGERPSDLVPAYVRSFDVGTVWFRVDDMTSAVTPLKMYECLAAGRPCVSTPLPAAVEAPLVRTGGTPAEFHEALKAALTESVEPEFQTAARQAALAASWSTRLQPVLERLAAQGELRA